LPFKKGLILSIFLRKTQLFTQFSQLKKPFENGLTTFFQPPKLRVNQRTKATSRNG